MACPTPWSCLFTANTEIGVLVSQLRIAGSHRLIKHFSTQKSFKFLIHEHFEIIQREVDVVKATVVKF